MRFLNLLGVTPQIHAGRLPVSSLHVQRKRREQTGILYEKRRRDVFLVHRDPIDLPLRENCDVEINASIGEVFSEVRKYL